MRILHIFDVSNFVYIGNVKKDSAVRGVRECDGAYIPNKAPVGGVTFLAEKVLNVLNCGEDVFLAFDRKPEYKLKMYKEVFGHEKEYKGQRLKNTGVYKQKDFAEQLMRMAGVPCGALEEYEADDVIYTIWKKYYNDYDYIRIHSEDSDLAFMVDNKTEIIPVKRDGRHITLESYMYTVHKTEITPYNMSLLLKVFLGDKSDNIAGTGDAVEWLTAVKEYFDEAGIKPEMCGDIDVCREVLIKVNAAHPELKNGFMALNILKLVTPCIINSDDFDIPGNTGNIRMLKAITGIMRPVREFPEIEDCLDGYITEYLR